MAINGLVFAIVTASVLGGNVWLVPGRYCDVTLVRSDIEGARSVLLPDLSTRAFPGVVHQYTAADGLYTSPHIFSAIVEGLNASGNYAYRLLDGAGAILARGVLTAAGCTGGGSAGGRLVVVGDPGQTDKSQAVLTAAQRRLQSSSAIIPRAAAVIGDLSYADGEPTRWDSWQTLVSGHEDVADDAGIAGAWPLRVLPGNHETYLSDEWRAYMARWAGSDVTAHSGNKESAIFACEAADELSAPGVWYTFTVGSIRGIALSAYTSDAVHGRSEILPARDDAQWHFLVAALSCNNIERDRGVRPFLVVLMHAPLYNSNTVHAGETDGLRALWEPLFVDAGVDVVIAGHVHSVEVSQPVVGGVNNASGPVYITSGHGGNREGLYNRFTQPTPVWSTFRGTTGWGYTVIEADPGNVSHLRVCVLVSVEADGALDARMEDRVLADINIVGQAVRRNTWRAGDDPIAPGGGDSNGSGTRALGDTVVALISLTLLCVCALMCTMCCRKSRPAGRAVRSPFGGAAMPIESASGASNMTLPPMPAVLADLGPRIVQAQVTATAWLGRSAGSVMAPVTVQLEMTPTSGGSQYRDAERNDDTLEVAIEDEEDEVDSTPEFVDGILTGDDGSQQHQIEDESDDIDLLPRTTIQRVNDGR